MRAVACVLATTLIVLAPRAADDPLAALATTIAARLVVVEEVARYKWNARLPASDPTREAALLTNTLNAAAAIGVSPDRARTIVEAQLAASRTLQINAFERWRHAAQPPFEHVRDLDRELRPQLDALTQRLLIEVRDTEDLLGSCRTPVALAAPTGIDSAIWAIAIEPLLPEEPCSG